MKFQNRHSNKFNPLKVASIAMLILMPLSILQGCSVSGSNASSKTASAGQSAIPPGIAGTEAAETILLRTPQNGSATKTVLSNRAEISVINLKNVLYHQVEGTFSTEAFSNLLAANNSTDPQARNSAVQGEINKAFGQLKSANIIALNVVPEFGYFTFMLPYSQDLMAPLKDIKFSQSFIFNPVVMDNSSLKQIKSMSPAAEGMVPNTQSGFNTKTYSGLERVGAIQFAKNAARDIGRGAVVDGSSVNIGITDTGITYNHPTFMSRDQKKNRIAYMKDFTREGRIYFSPTAKFAATDVDGDPTSMNINAEVIITPSLPNMPMGDTLNTIKDLKIKVSPPLRELLKTAGGNAKFGVLMEASFQGEEAVDINANGKMDDELPVIFIPGTTPETSQIFVDFTGTGDFSTVAPLGDFNTTKTTAKVFAEKIGFEFQADKLPSADGKSIVQVTSASVVGFDPGDHGTHVSGIAAGSKTIMNDSPDTLARGVAPAATILMNRVCANNGGCNADEALIDHALNSGAEVVNMSLGGLSPFNDGYGVQEILINRITALKNVLFVISAGNSGPGLQTVGSPSVARLALSIGATASQAMIQSQYQWPASTVENSSEKDSDFMLFFSSRGPTASGGFRPNVSAPGTELSSVQLNSAPGSRSGLDVYWGTSMAAPTATGSYALLLDGIKKYNRAHPSKALTTDARVLRDVLIETARPFDMDSMDPVTGKHNKGTYTWVDEGTGMINLPAAWDKLIAMAKANIPTAVMQGQTPVNLDYEILVPETNPSGVAYDGSRAGDQSGPAFGSGLYLNFNTSETVRPVFIARRLPENLMLGADAGDLTRVLEDTKDDFVLKTTIYGSDKVWLKAGAKDETDCMNTASPQMTLLGRGAEVQVGKDGKGAVNPFNSSVLNVCLDRHMITNDLPAGDNGALISAYRVVNGKVSATASFVVPVYVTVPHKRLVDSKGYDTTIDVKSFEVSRNYIDVPVGTSLVMVTLEIPAIKTDAAGRAAPGQECSGIELMALEGNNLAGSFKTRAEARITNCTTQGAPSEAKRVLTIQRQHPNAGIWDLDVLGSYRFPTSHFRMKVDYVTASSSVAKIEGDTSVLSGAMVWSKKESSVDVSPDTTKSSVSLHGLYSETAGAVPQDGMVMVPNPTGIMRSYSADTKSVTITTGGSPHNDIDLIILSCSSDAKDLMDPSCQPIGASNGPTDNESVTFTPKADTLYGAVVSGSTVTNEGNFTSSESIELTREKGSIAVSGAGPDYAVTYNFSGTQISASKLLQNPLFTSGQYMILGSLNLRTATDAVLDIIPIRIKK